MHYTAQSRCWVDVSWPNEWHIGSGRGGSLWTPSYKVAASLGCSVAYQEIAVRIPRAKVCRAGRPVPTTQQMPSRCLLNKQTYTLIPRTHPLPTLFAVGACLGQFTGSPVSKDLMEPGVLGFGPSSAGVCGQVPSTFWASYRFSCDEIKTSDIWGSSQPPQLSRSPGGKERFPLGASESGSSAAAGESWLPPFLPPSLHPFSGVWRSNPQLWTQVQLKFLSPVSH